MKRNTAMEVLRSIAGIRLDGEPDPEGNDSEMEIDDAYRLLSDAVESARDVVSRDPAEHVRILREALTKVTVGLQQANEGYSDDNFGDEIRAGLSALEATKEGA